MDGQPFTHSFIFNTLIDPETLHSLYDNDYPYMEEIFKMTLDNWEADQQAIESSYQKGDLEGLRKAVHKMKPAFGFIGILSMQEKCRQLEESCKKVSSVHELGDEPNTVLSSMKECKRAVEDDHRKLMLFNKR